MIKKYMQSLASITTMLLALSGLSGCGNSNETASATAASIAMSSPLAVYSDEDMNDTWDASSAVTVNLNGNTIAVNGSGATAAGSTLTIAAAGTYVLSGTLPDGQIIVSAGKNDTVRLVMNGVTLAYSDGPPIYCQQAAKTIITLGPGTSNSVSDGSSYLNSADEDQPDAAIFSQDDLTINGSGTLTVTGNSQNGIDTKDDLVITGGNINITAVNDGLRGRDSVAINNGNFVINAKSDGIQANNDEDTSKGWISLDGGKFNITAGQDGIQAETILQVWDGELNLTTGGGSASVSNTPTQAGGPGRGFNNPQATDESTVSTKGIKAGAGILVSSGVVAIDSADDAIHSQGDVLIAGGTFTLLTGDDGVHGDANVTINEGSKLTITKSYEGLEGMTVAINGGDISLTSSDDGINAAGGSDGNQTGQDNFKSSDNNQIRIAGGYVYVNAGGDGIDSNGNLYLDGGTVIVNGPTNNGNGALDYNGTCEQKGGILVAAGSSGMAQAPAGSSSQNSILVYYTAVQKAGILVNLADESGKSLLTFAPAKDYQAIVISMPELAQGKTYILSSGGTCTGTSVNGLYNGGTYTGGTKLTSITVSGALTSIADDGSAVTNRGGMNGGPGGPGGQGGPGTRPLGK